MKFPSRVNARRWLQFLKKILLKMSYDIFCYKSESGIPNEDEADTIIESDNEGLSNKESSETKFAIVKALTSYNSRLEAFDFDYAEIAKLTSTTIKDAQNKFDHIELNSPEGDIAIQMTVYNNHVFITVPYWYQNEQANEVNNLIRNYIKIIWDTAKYFVYDPQSGQTFDPSKNNFDGLEQYLSICEHLDEVTSTKETKTKKAWWKFW